MTTGDPFSSGTFSIQGEAGLHPCPKCSELVQVPPGSTIPGEPDRHEACGYCIHPNVEAPGKCGLCGRRLQARKGTRTKRRRHIRVPQVDLGDGNRVDVWLVLDPKGITVRRVGSRRAWWVPIGEAAGLLARRGQVRACNEGAK